MTTDISDSLLSRIVDDLAEYGWSLQAQFATSSLTRQLAEECRLRIGQGTLAPAGTGRANAVAVREGTRGDHIQWLEAGQSGACDSYLALLDGLRVELNRSLYLGLVDYESHFAFYPPGAFYLKHLDRFLDDDRRAVSAVLYLNDDWLPEEGGALRLYLADGQVRDVLPQAGTLVVFLSADVPHEVLPASRDRLSLTGWFRRRGDGPF
ncbi:2OG-Fe(II) oxygenase [Phytopseudomonas dryadis]|uniref:2OG-Fe(II) oxygenase n=1 Tax=Phytopseudomonas dryadis TaxID=2487520 RepID=A0ABY1Z7C4_9GAMM|nr:MULTISPECIES: 2OG-Fe(II) oxygenase [Pseudomonas]TBV03048.1 2OG-Fe(II) oxygenase [Pseudomonas dryadis]TBV17675.1 2OG-Fe(II) oxygenase [Pseudomonas sp. FRB 230]